MRLFTQAVCRAHAHDLEDCEPDGGSCPCHRPAGSKPCPVPNVLTEADHKAAGMCSLMLLASPVWDTFQHHTATNGGVPLRCGWHFAVRGLQEGKIRPAVYGGPIAVLSIHRLCWFYDTRFGRLRVEHLTTRYLDNSWYILADLGRVPRVCQGFWQPLGSESCWPRGFQRTADSEDEVWAAGARGTAAFSPLRCWEPRFPASNFGELPAPSSNSQSARLPLQGLQIGAGFAEVCPERILP